MPAINGATVTPEDEGTGVTDPDYVSAGHVSGLSADGNTTDYVARGMNFQNVGSGTFDISAGIAYLLYTGTIQVQDNNGDYVKDWSQGVKIAVHSESATTGISYTQADVNYVFIDVDLTTNNGATYEVKTTDSAPAEPSLKIGKIDDT